MIKEGVSALDALLKFLVAGGELHPRPPGYEPGELLLLHPAAMINLAFFLYVYNVIF